MSVFSTIRSYVLWQHERGTLHYDIMVTLILIFIFFSPRVINFNDKPAAMPAHRSSVVVSTDDAGELVYEVDAQRVTGGDDAAIRSQLMQIIEPVSGEVTILKYEKTPDLGRAPEYRVWVKRKS